MINNDEKIIRGKCIEQQTLEKKIIKKAEKNKQLDLQLEEIMDKITSISKDLERSNLRLVF